MAKKTADSKTKELDALIKKHQKNVDKMDGNNLTDKQKDEIRALGHLKAAGRYLA